MENGNCTLLLLLLLLIPLTVFNPHNIEYCDGVSGITDPVQVALVNIASYALNVNGDRFEIVILIPDMVGGLLARTDRTGSAYYHTDGSGNITALIDANQFVAARERGADDSHLATPGPRRLDEKERARDAAIGLAGRWHVARAREARRGGQILHAPLRLLEARDQLAGSLRIPHGRCADGSFCGVREASDHARRGLAVHAIEQRR